MSRVPLTILCAVLAICASGVVGAHDFCVATASDLRLALAAASDGGDNDNEDNHINMVAATYSTSDGSGDRFLYNNTSATSALHLWGGFSAGCSLMGEDASVTVLDGAGASQVLVARSSLGEVDLLNFTVQNAKTDQPGAGIAVNDTGSTSGDVLLRNLILRNNHTSSSHGGFRAFARGTHVIYFDNNLVFGNIADEGYSAGELFGAAQVYVRYNTVTLNTAPGSNAGGLFCGGSPCEIANDVFWQNDNIDLYLFEDGTLYFDDIGVLQGSVPSISQDVLAIDPVFVNAMAGDFHLGNGSPLIGVSTYHDSDSDNDIEGHELPLTGKTDLGAYIETIFHDGFE